MIRISRCARLAAVALFLAGCSRAPRDPVLDCLQGAVAAAEARDAEGVLARVSANFRDAEGGGKPDAAALVKRHLAAYESLSLVLSDVAIERGPAAAQAKFKVRMSGKPRAVGGLDAILPRSSRWSFDARLEAGPNGWTVVSASWTQLEGDG